MISLKNVARIDQSVFQSKVICTIGTNLKIIVLQLSILKTITDIYPNEMRIEYGLKVIVREMDYENVTEGEQLL